jgi:hypothetical protein
MAGATGLRAAFGKPNQPAFPRSFANLVHSPTVTSGYLGLLAAAGVTGCRYYLVLPRLQFNPLLKSGGEPA